MNIIAHKIAALKTESTQNRIYFDSICSLESLLTEIDFDAEIVPLDNINKLQNLFTDIKGSSLTHVENLVIEKLVIG